MLAAVECAHLAVVACPLALCTRLFILLCVVSLKVILCIRHYSLDVRFEGVESLFLRCYLVVFRKVVVILGVEFFELFIIAIQFFRINQAWVEFTCLAANDLCRTIIRIINFPAFLLQVV